MTPSTASFYACVGIWVLAMSRTTRTPMPRWLMGTLLGIVVVQVVWMSTVVVHGPWATMTHGLERYADIRDQARPVNLEHLHGPGFAATVGLLAKMGLDPYRASLLLMSAIAPFLALASWWSDDDPIAAVSIGALFAASPLVLRLGPTTSLYVPAVLLLAMGLAASSLWLRTGQRGALVATSAAVVAAAHTRADFLLFAPAVVGLRILIESPRALSSPRELLLGAWPGLLILPRLAELIGGSDTRTGHGPSLALPDHLTPWLVLLAAVLLLFRTPLGTRIAARVGWPVPLAIAIAAAIQLGARTPWPELAQMSPFLHAGHTSPAAWLGLLAALLLAPPRRTLWLSACIVLGAALYWPAMDSASTWVRTGLAPWFAWCWLAGQGVATLPRRAAVGLLVLICGTGPWLTHDWLRWSYPRQQEFALLQDVRERLPPGATLTILTTDDVPQGVTVDTHHQLLRRSGIPRFLGGRNHATLDVNRAGTPRGEEQPWTLQSISTALDGPTKGPHYFLQTLDCHRHLVDPTSLEVVAGDHAVMLERATPISMARPERDFDLHAIAHSLPAADAYCRAMHANFHSEVIVEVPVHDGNLGAAREQVVSSEPKIGLYRLTQQPTSE